jgi:hypothetical protein
MVLADIGTALLAVGVPVYHYAAHKQPDAYIVWAEDGQANAIWADGRMQEQAISGTVDYFTKMEYDANIALIQAALNDAGVSWRLESVQYEEFSGYIHHEWSWSAWLE